MASYHHHMTPPQMENPNNSMIVWRKCTPFCDKTQECEEHHEILQAIVNCTDQLGHLSNLDVLKGHVEKYQSLGWNKDDNIPDPVPMNRLPVIHWTASLGKCNALEWMLSYGFDPTVTISGSGENALHRTIMYLYRSRPKFTTKELKPKFRKICGLLSNLMNVPDYINGDTPLHLAANLLVTSESRLVFFQTAIEVMSLQTRDVSEAQCSATLDARNNDGNTCLHILAGASEKGKAEHACNSIISLLRAGADKTIKNNLDQTPLDIAISKGCNYIVDELVKIVCPAPQLNDRSVCVDDPRNLMTMVDIPSRTRPNTGHSNSMTQINRSFYGNDGSRSPTRSRSPIDISYESSPTRHAGKYGDHDIPIVEPSSFAIKQEDVKSELVRNFVAFQRKQVLSKDVDVKIQVMKKQETGDPQISALFSNKGLQLVESFSFICDDPWEKDAFQDVDVKFQNDSGQPALYPMSPASMSSTSDSPFDVNSPLLNHLREAGLLNEVSDLLTRAKARDEGQLRRYQQQAKDLETQITYKLKEIDRIKHEVDTLRHKRTRCDEEVGNLRKRLASCSNAIKELPSNQASANGGFATPSATPPALIPGSSL